MEQRHRDERDVALVSCQALTSCIEAAMSSVCEMSAPRGRPSTAAVWMMT